MYDNLNFKLEFTSKVEFMSVKPLFLYYVTCFYLILKIISRLGVSQQQLVQRSASVQSTSAQSTAHSSRPSSQMSSSTFYNNTNNSSTFNNSSTSFMQQQQPMVGDWNRQPSTPQSAPPTNMPVSWHYQGIVEIKIG